MKTDISKSYTTRDHKPVRILCTDGPDHIYPVIGIIEGDTCTSKWTIEGVYNLGSHTHPHDLIEVPEPELWAKEKAAFAAGKEIEFKVRDHPDDSWDDVANPWWSEHCIYRIKPEPVLVPLEAHDIKAGDEFLLPHEGRRYQWRCVSEEIVHFSSTYYKTFTQLKEAGWQIRSLGETEWRPCHKEGGAA